MFRGNKRGVRWATLMPPHSSFAEALLDNVPQGFARHEMHKVVFFRVDDPGQARKEAVDRTLIEREVHLMFEQDVRTVFLHVKLLFASPRTYHHVHTPWKAPAENRELHWIGLSGAYLDTELIHHIFNR